jgi:hypothetical protein
MSNRVAFTEKHGFPYWIAHGTLLAWHWNQDIMSWDDDIDLQVPGEVLYDIALFNSTYARCGRIFVCHSGYIPVSLALMILDTALCLR